MDKVPLGRLGERIVATRLVRRGYVIVDANVRMGPLEVDLIAEREGTLVFCEVRTRTVGTAVDPLLTFPAAKINRVRRAALHYLTARAPAYEVVRFDAAAVLVDLRRRRALVRYRASAF